MTNKLKYKINWPYVLLFMGLFLWALWDSYKYPENEEVKRDRLYTLYDVAEIYRFEDNLCHFLVKEKDGTIRFVALPSSYDKSPYKDIIIFEGVKQ